MINLIGSEHYQKQLYNTGVLESGWDRLSGKTVLITGATGMICSYLVDLLMQKNIDLQPDKKIKLIVVTRNAQKAKTRFGISDFDNIVTIVESDVSECREKLSEYKVDYIVAGAGNADPINFARFPVDTIKGNYEGAAALLDIARRNGGCRMVYLSTGEIYGNAGTSAEAFAENDSYYVNPLEPRSCYPCSKRLAENLCVSYSRQYGVEVCIARLCYIYGPTFQKTDSRSVVQFLLKAVSGEDIVLKSKGEQVRSYCYIADAVSAIVFLLLKGKKAEAYNICDEKSNLSIKEFADMLAETAKVNCVFDLPTEEEKQGYSKVSKAVQDPTKINQLGWYPKYSIRQGLEQTMNILAQAITQ